VPLWFLKMCHLFNDLFYQLLISLAKTDLIDRGICKGKFCTLIFTIVALVLITEQNVVLIGMVTSPCFHPHTYPKPPE